jgi:uncharacterized protein
MPTQSSAFAPGPSTRVRRKERARGEAEFIEQVIDESLVAHVAFCNADGLPQCLPMAFARVGQVLYLHGALASQLLHNVSNTRCSLTFTLLDGLVFARSAFHHSMNYRCVVAIGSARVVDDEVEKRTALSALVEHAAKGRSLECIDMTAAEVRSTRVVAVDVQEAVAKQRQGAPVDDAEHVALGQHFAGVLPLSLRAGSIERDVPSVGLAVPPALNQCAQAFGAQPVYDKQEGPVLYSSDPSRIDFEWLHRVMSTEAYWALGIDGETLKNSWSHSLVFGVYAASRQVACARVLTDFSRIAYLGDVFVDAEYRGRGYGQALVKFVLAHPAVAGCDRVLLGTRDAQGLYQRLGFVESQASAMLREKPAVAKSCP